MRDRRVLIAASPSAMPPRRSSRSTRASIEPSQPEALPAKRKRGQTAEAMADEAETSQKPPSRAKRAPARSGSASAPKSRTSTRGKTSLPEVAESQAEEESDTQPAKKRSRPSDEGLQNVKLEEQNELMHNPVSGKGSRGSKRQMEGARPRARASDAPSEAEQSVPFSLEESANRQTSDVEDDDIPDFKPKPSPRKQRQSTREPVVEEEDEKSLFEPPPMPPPPSTVPPPPEEPSGPKSRLMIHMMALVNFKSYAGRQVIGPFHKVRMYNVPLNLSQVRFVVVVLSYCWAQWFWQI